MIYSKIMCHLPEIDISARVSMENVVLLILFQALGKKAKSAS